MRRPVVAFVLLASLSAVFWLHRIHIDQPSLDGGPGNADAFRYFYPTAVYLHEELARGNLPIWNPYQLAGQPFLAFHITGVLYPPNVILMGLLDPALALEVHAIAHVLVAGFFTWLFARRIGLAAPASFAAAFAYMLSGALLLGVYATPYFSTPAWLPGILWAVHGLAREGSLRFSLALALLLALCFLGGYAQGFVYIAQLAALYAVFALAVVTPRAQLRRTIGLFALAGLLSLGFVAPQLLPTLELTRSSVRSFEGLTFEEASSSPYFSPGLIAQGLLRGLGPDLEPVGLGPVKWRVTFPLLMLPLLVCGVLARSQRAHWILFVALMVAAGLFLLGPLTPLFELYYRLPLGNLFRGPGRLIIVYAFLGAIAMAIGIEGVSQWLQRWRRDLPVAAIAASALALLVGLDYYARSELEVLHPSLGAPHAGAPAALIEFMKANPEERLFVQNLGLKRPEIFYKLGMMNELFVVPDYEPSMPEAYARYFEPRRSPPWHGEASAVGNLRPRAPHPAALLLDLMSVRYYAVRGSSSEKVKRELEAFVGGRRRKLGDAFVFERVDALPRAYVVPRAERVADVEAALARIREPSFDPRGAVVLVGSAAPADPATSAAGPAADPIGRASIVGFSAESVEIAAECADRCTLVLTDLHYPGWRARVGEQELPILLANGLYRGVELPAGEHRVVFRYEPASFRIGLVLLLCSVLASGYCLLAMRTSETPSERSKRASSAAASR